MVSAGAGNDLLVNCGMFATGMTCSQEQLVMDAEISEMSLRLAKGMEVNADTIAADLIKQIGPQGEGYLTAEHTMSYLRSDEYYTPKLAVRGPRASWEAAGSRDTYQIARDIVSDYAAQPAVPLDPVRAAKMEEIIKGF